MKPLDTPPKVALCKPREGFLFPYAQCKKCSRSIPWAGGEIRPVQHPPTLDKAGECPSRLEMK